MNEKISKRQMQLWKNKMHLYYFECLCGNMNYCSWKTYFLHIQVFSMFDIVIIWSVFEQKWCSWTFFISAFHSYFVKKITEHLCHYFSFYLFFLKKPFLRKFPKIITFSDELTTKLTSFHDFNQEFFTIAFLNSKHCKQHQKSFDSISNLVKIINKKWDFFINPQNGYFYKNGNKIFSFKNFSPIFFYKIWTKCRYEKCPKTWFLLKNWSNSEHIKPA